MHEPGNRAGQIAGHNQQCLAKSVRNIGSVWSDCRRRGRLAPRELRTSFVSLMSHQGVSIEEIARLVGHATTRTTEIVYRRELRPVITTGAEIMDQLFTGT